MVIITIKYVFNVVSGRWRVVKINDSFYDGGVARETGGLMS
jgi:hypothetical protein